MPYDSYLTYSKIVKGTEQVPLSIRHSMSSKVVLKTTAPERMRKYAQL